MRLLSLTTGLLSVLLSCGTAYAEQVVELSVADFTKVAKMVELQRQAIATIKKLDAVKSQHIKELNEALASCETISTEQDKLVMQAKDLLAKKDNDLAALQKKSDQQTYGVWASVGLAVAAVIFGFAK